MRANCLHVLALGFSIVLSGCGGGGGNGSGGGSNPPTLKSIAISPSAPRVNLATPPAAATTQQFSATGTYSDGSTKDVTASVTWSSSQTNVATINNAGLAKAVGSGTTTIQASLSGLTSTTSLTVVHQLVSVTVTGNSNMKYATPPSAPTTQQFTATANYNDGTTQDVTSQATWTSTNTSVASISATGVVSALSPGNSTIQAVFSNVTGTMNVTVVHQLLSIAVTPSLASNGKMAPGTSSQFTATGSYNDNTTADLTSSVTWSSSDSSVATVSDIAPTKGLVTAVAQGNTTILATLGSISGNVPLEVSGATISSISVSPSSITSGIGSVQKFVATGTFSDGSTQDISNVSTWTSSKTDIASSNGGGYFLNKGLGSTNITASWNGQTSTAAETVDTSSVLSLAVSPSTAQIAFGTQIQLHAVATLKDGSTYDVTFATGTVWSSTSPSNTATVTGGLVTATVAESVSVTATLGSFSSTASLTVTNATATSISISPASATVPLTTTRTLKAIAVFSDKSTQDVSGVAVWDSLQKAVATVVSPGIVTALSGGTATITATFGGQTGTATIIAGTPTLVSLSVSPVTNSINLQSPTTTALFFVTGTYSDDSTQLLTTSASWDTSDHSIATIAPGGVASGVSTGTAMVIATYQGLSATGTLNVTSSPLNQLVITPSSNAKVAINTNIQFTATGIFADGTSSNFTRYVHWTTSDPTIATIGNTSNNNNAGGLSFGVNAGTVSVGATYNNVSATPVTLNVTSAQVTSIAVTPSSTTLTVGSSVTFKAMATFDDGTTEDISSIATWSSDNPAVFGFSSGATGSGISAGSATVSAQFESFTGTAPITVQ